MGTGGMASLKAHGESQENHREAGPAAVTPLEHPLLKPLLPRCSVTCRLTLKLGTIFTFPVLQGIHCPFTAPYLSKPTQRPHTRTWTVCTRPPGFPQAPSHSPCQSRPAPGWLLDLAEELAWASHLDFYIGHQTLDVVIQL